MAFTAKDVLERARVTLSDATSTRWPLPELLLWLNDGVREVHVLAPEIVSEVVVLDLSAGAKQSLPATVAQVLRVICNVTVASGTTSGGLVTGGTVSRGKAITATRKHILDAIKPGWADDSVWPHSVDVAHFVEDDMTQGAYYVVPGNDGTGLVEAVVVKHPTDLAEPASPLDIDSYAALTVAANDRLRNALVDYVVSKAYEKDMAIPGAAQISVNHYTRFIATLTAIRGGELRANPAAVSSQPMA